LEKKNSNINKIDGSGTAGSGTAGSEEAGAANDNQYEYEMIDIKF
jgi:hypothetical protein